MIPDAEVLERGTGPTLVMIHGSAADRTTWTVQLAMLADTFRMIAYNRVGVPSQPVSEGDTYTVERHAADAAELIERRATGAVIAVGSSFGAVVVLELARTRPELIRGMVLCEPPLSPSDWISAVPTGFGCQFDRIVSERGGEAGGELFLRTVLTDRAYDRVPAAWQKRSKRLWAQVRSDMVALGRYRVRYHELTKVDVPALLLTGEHSADFYRATIESLDAALKSSRVLILKGAGHMMQADAHRRFNKALREFATSV